MNHPPSQQKKVAVPITIALILAIVGTLLVNIWLPNYDVVSFIGAMATLAIALLTVAYLIVTSKQLGVMDRQLQEMARTRELEAQPLPYLEITKVFLERPRFFYTPPEDKYEATFRLFVNYRLSNRGAHPAVNVITAARVTSHMKNEVITLDGGAEEISVLGPGEWHPPTKENSNDFLFAEDRITTLLSILRDRSFRNPALLSIRVIYRNILGGCFANSWYFAFAPRSEEDFDILANWDSRLVSFQTEYKEQINELRKLREKDSAAWEELFKGLKKNLDESLKGGKENDLAWFQIPNTFHAEVISRERYKAELQESRFGTPIPQWITSCIAKETEGQ
jgi:hypothetical protein